VKILFIIKRIIRQIVNDKRSLGLILVVPLFLLSLIFLLLGDSGYKAKIAVSGIPLAISDKITAQGVTVTQTSLFDGRALVNNKTVDAFFYIEDNQMNLLFESNDAVKTGVVTKSIQTAIKELSPGSFMKAEFIYGKSDDSMFNSLGYIMLGIISFFIVFIIAGISFVRERTNQTMERLMMTPVKRWEVVCGYTLGFGFFAALQSIILIAFVKWVLKMPIAGSVLTTGLIMILLSLSAVCIGAFFSIFSNNEFQIMQFIPVVVVPQIFFSGLISLDTLPFHLGMISRIMPVYYACDALKGVAIKGEGLLSILPDITALLVFIVIFSCFNTVALKKFRRI